MGGWQCLCFAILLLPTLDAGSVKLVHTGTETFEKDGVKHERSRYRLVPDHENHEPPTVDKQAETIAIKVLPNEEHNDNLTVDKHAKKVAIKILPNDGHRHSLKTDEDTNKVDLTTHNEAQEKLKAALEKNKKGNITYHYSTKTHPQSGATHKTTYHYSTKTQPSATNKTESKVTGWSSGRNVNNSTSQNLWNKDPSKDLDSHFTRRQGDNKDHKLSHNKKIDKKMFSKKILELLNKQVDKQGHHEIAEHQVEKEGGHDDLQWRLTRKKLLQELLSKMHTFKNHTEAAINHDSKKNAESASALLNKATHEHSNDVLMASQELENHGVADNGIIQQNLYSVNTLAEHKDHEHDNETLRQNRYRQNTQGEDKVYGNDQEKLQKNLLTLNTHENDHDLAYQEEKQQGLVRKQNLTKHLLVNEASRPKTLALGHSARLETETLVHNDTYKDIQESNLQTRTVPYQTSKHTKTEYRPFEITNAKYDEKPIQFNHTDLLRSLISSVGLNKTFVMPGEKGRYKLVHEGDEDTDINSALIHWIKSQKNHISPLNTPKKNIYHGDGHFEDVLKVLPLHHTESNHKKHAQTVPDINTHIPVSIYHHDVNEIPPERASGLYSITETNIHLDKELSTITSITEKSDVSAELKMVFDAFQATTTDNKLSSPDNELAVDNILTTTDHGTNDNGIDSITSATENPKVSTTEDNDISKILNDPSMLELLSLYGLDINDIVDESEINMAILSTTNQPVTIIDGTTEGNGSNIHRLDKNSTPEGHEVSTTEAIDISKLENNPALLELLSSYGFDMHDLVDKTEKHFAIPSFNAHGFTIHNRTTTTAIETDYDRAGVTSTTVNYEVATSEVNNISKPVKDPSLLELLSSYGLDMHDIFDDPEIKIMNILAAQPYEATEAINYGIDRHSTTENIEVSTTEVLDNSMVKNDPSLLELLTSYGLKVNDIVDKQVEKIAIPSLTAPPDSIVDRTTTKATDANKNDHDISKTTDNQEMLTTKAIDIPKLINYSSWLDLPTSHGLEKHDIIDDTETYMTMPSPTDDTIRDDLEKEATNEKEAIKYRDDLKREPDDNEESTAKDIDMAKLLNVPSLRDLLASYGLKMHEIVDKPRVKMANHSLNAQPDTTGDSTTTEANNEIFDVTSTTENIKVSTTEIIDISKLENVPSLLDLLNSFGLKIHNIVDEPDVHSATTLTAHGDVIDRKATEENIAKSVVSSEEYATVAPQQNLGNIINYFTHLQTANHLPETNNHVNTSEVHIKPLFVLDEINKGKDDYDDLKEKLPALLENETEKTNLLELELNITDDPLNEYENLPTEPVDNHNSSLLGPYIDDDDLKFRMDNLQREPNIHENVINVSSNDLVNSEQTIQEPNQLKDLNQTWPKSWQAKETPRSSRIIYREEIRNSGNDNNRNMNVHNNLNFVKQLDNARLNAVAPDHFDHDVLTYHSKDANHESLQAPNKNVNDHYLDIILGYLNSDILTNELNALMAYSGPGQDRHQVTLQFVVKYLNKLGITHNISQEQLQFLTHEVLKHLLDYNKQYQVRKIELIYEFHHPHDLATNVNPVYMPPKNVLGEFLSYPDNVRTQENVRHVLPDDHLYPNSYHQSQQNNVDDHKHNLALHPDMGDVSDKTHLLSYNENPDLVALSDVNAHPRSHESSNQNHVVSVSDHYNTPSVHHLINQDLYHIAPHQTLHAQNSNIIRDGNSVLIEQRGLFPDSDQGLSQKSKNESNEHNLNNDHTNSNHLNLVPGDIDHQQHTDQLTPNYKNKAHLHSEHSHFTADHDHNLQNHNLAPNHNGNLTEKELVLDHHNSDHHLVDSDNSNFAPGQDYNYKNDNISQNHNVDLNEHDLDLEHHNFNNEHIHSDHLNLLPEHKGHHQPNANLDSNHNVDQNEQSLNSDQHNPDHQLFDSDHLNSAPGQQHHNYHVVPNQIAHLNKNELYLGQNYSNNNHDVDSDNVIPNLESDHHHPDHVDSDYLNLVPDHHGHHQQNNHLTPNHNVGNNEHTLSIDNHYTDDYLAEREHLNLAPGQDNNHKNDYLTPNQNASLNIHESDLAHNNSKNNHHVQNFVPNSDSDHHHPENHNVDSDQKYSDDHLLELDHSNSALRQDEYYEQNHDLDPNHNVDLNKHHFNSDHHNAEQHVDNSEHTNSSPNTQNNHLVPNQNRQHSNNRDVNSDHLTDLDPEHHGHHQQNDHLAPNHNPVLNTHTLNYDSSLNQHLVDSNDLNSVTGHHHQNENLPPNHGSFSDQPNIGSNQYDSNPHWGAQPDSNFDPYSNLYSSHYQQLWPLQTDQSNLVNEPHFSTLDHQQNGHLLTSPPYHQIEPWSYKENGNSPYQVSADQLSLYYTFPNQQFNYLEASLYPQPDNFGQWAVSGSDYNNQPNPYPPYPYPQKEWNSPYQALSPEQLNGAFYGLAYPNIDLSSYFYQPYQLSYSDQNVNVDQRINLPITNQHNGYETLGILDGTQLQEYLTDGIDLPNPGVVSGLATKVHSLVGYLLDHGVSENIVLEFVDDVKKQLAEEFLERLKDCQNRAYSILVQSISNLAQVYLQKHR